MGGLFHLIVQLRWPRRCAFAGELTPNSDSEWMHRRHYGALLHGPSRACPSRLMAMGVAVCQLEAGLRAARSLALLPAQRFSEKQSQ